MIDKESMTVGACKADHESTTAAAEKAERPDEAVDW
jgi:hypothetical protein